MNDETHTEEEDKETDKEEIPTVLLSLAQLKHQGGTKANGK